MQKGLLALLLLTVALVFAREPPRLPKVASSGNHGLIVLPSGKVKVFGGNESWELGLGAAGKPVRSDMEDLPGITDAVDIVASPGASYLLRADSTMLAWGKSKPGQLGLGTPGTLPKRWEFITPWPVPLPTPVPGLAGARQLAANTSYAMALLEDGTVRVWGNCGHWKLDGVVRDDKNDARVPFPAAVTGLSGVKAISAERGRFGVAFPLFGPTIQQLGLTNTLPSPVPANRSIARCTSILSDVVLTVTIRQRCARSTPHRSPPQSSCLRHFGHAMEFAQKHGFRCWHVDDNRLACLIMP